MKARMIAGVVLLLIGLVWIAQGLDLLKGSSMTGQGHWAVIGSVVAIIGVGLIGWVLALRRERPEATWAQRPLRSFVSLQRAFLTIGR